MKEKPEIQLLNLPMGSYISEIESDYSKEPRQSALENMDAISWLVSLMNCRMKQQEQDTAFPTVEKTGTKPTDDSSGC